jgi:hypothetical protein
MKKLWKEHGTKILGAVVITLGAVGSAEAQIKMLLPERGGITFDLLMNILNYLFIGAGAAVIRRGFTNSATSDSP